MLSLVLVALIASPGLASAANGDNITATESVSFTKRVADIDNCVFHDATIDWGDGSSSAGQFDTGTTPGVKGTHTYAEEGTFNGSVTYNTDCTTNGKVTFTATVADVGVTATGRDISATVGQPATGVVSHFTDADPNGTTSDYSAQINWGDGSSSAGTVSASSAGGFDVTGTHTYHSTGQAAVNVTIKDVGGASAPSSSTATIAAVPPPLKAAFGWYPEMPCQGGPGGRPTFDASASQGAIATFRWTITDFNAPGNTEVYDNPTGWGPPGWEHPAGYPLNAQTVGTRVHFIRNPTTVTLTVFDSAGNSNSVQHTITYSDPVEVWIVKVGYTEAGAGVSTTFFPYYYLAPEHPHYCGGALLGSQYISASFTSAPTTLSGTGSLTTTVSCSVRADCIGTLYALRPGELKGHLGRTGVRDARRRRRRIAPYLGRTTFLVFAGRKRKVVIHLKRHARRLARAGRLKKVELLLLAPGHKPRVVTVRVRRRKHCHQKGRQC